MSSKSWLVIFDPTLRSFEGHSYNYDSAVADEARERFDHVLIFADEAFHAAGAPDAAIRSIPQSPLMKALRSLVGFVLPRKDSAALPNAPSGAPPQALLRLWKQLRAAGIASSLMRVLRQLDSAPQDSIHVFLQRADLYEISAVDVFQRRYGARMRSRVTFHLLLRHDPEITRAAQESTQLFRARLNRLSAAVNPDIRFLTDSEPIARAYRALTGEEAQFAVVPIPVSRKLSAPVRGRTVGTPALARISMLGSPRIEKGFGTLPQLVPLFEAAFPDAPVRLAVQIDRRVADPNVLRVIQWLRAYATRRPDHGPCVELLEGPAPEEVYFSWLARTDILLAPYISPKYIASTSGVFVEALHGGVPCVAWRGTWLSGLIREARQRELQIGEVAESLEEIPTLARAVWTRLPHYRADIATYLDEWKRRHSCGVAEILAARQYQ